MSDLLHALVTFEHRPASAPKPVSVCPGRARSHVVVEALVPAGDEEAAVAALVKGLREGFARLRANPPSAADSSHR